MHKPVISLTVPAAALASLALLPGVVLKPLTLLAIIIAASMAAWALAYLRLQQRRRMHD